MEWRLILDGKRRPGLNMALDEAILHSIADGRVPPTIRLYDWESPSISLGFFQKLDRARIDLAYCREQGIEIVRRPTGGRAVLHGHDVTFSISLGEEDLPHASRSIQGSHAWLMSGIAAGLNLLGIEAEIGPHSEVSERFASADCFAHVAECDIRAGREKIAGAAQLRKSGAILEQGSVPFTSPEVPCERIFMNSHAPVPPERVLSSGVTREQVEQALVRGFEHVLGISLVHGAFTSDEIETALGLERMKYASPEWTQSRGRVCIDKSI